MTVPDRTKCRFHGGKTPRGVASPHFKHGRYSKDLPQRLLARYEEARADPLLLELRDEVALADTRLIDLLGRVDSGESGQRWRQARQDMNEVLEAVRMSDGDMLRDALRTLDHTIRAGVADYQAWHEVEKTLALRTRLVESERKRMVEQRQMVAADQVMALVAAVVDVIGKRVSDPRVLSAISEDLAGLLTIEE